MANILLFQTQRDDKFPNFHLKQIVYQDYTSSYTLQEYLNKHWGFSTIVRHKFYTGPQIKDTQTYFGAWVIYGHCRVPIKSFRGFCSNSHQDSQGSQAVIEISIKNCWGSGYAYFSPINSAVPQTEMLLQQPYIKLPLDLHLQASEHWITTRVIR